LDKPPHFAEGFREHRGTIALTTLTMVEQPTRELVRIVITLDNIRFIKSYSDT